MAKPYPQEIKDQAAALYTEGLSTVEIGRRLGIPQPTIHGWVTPKGQAHFQARAQDSEYKERQKERDKARHADPENKERKKERDKAYKKERYATDPAFRTLGLLRCRTRHALKGNIIKSASTEELLGISALELTERWGVEYGPDWQKEDFHIDHIRPCSSFDVADPAQQRLCFNYRNLQLLPAVENQDKGDAWTKEMEAAWVTRMRDLGWDGEFFLVHPPG